MDSDADGPPPTASFETLLTGVGNNTGIVVPPEVLEQLGAGRRPSVSVDLNGHTFRTTVGSMSGNAMVPVSAAIRAATGLRAGDQIHVSLTVEVAPRTVDVPADLAAALDAAPAARAFFDALPNSLQRYHVDNVTGTKNAETRQRRVDKAIALFLDGKKR